jgi:CRP-like cAMP-binding protein
VILFSISDMDYRNILFNYKNSEKQKYCRFLSFINFFSSWTFNKLQQFSSSLVKVCFKAGCTIYDFQEESQVFYIIKSGKVELQTMIEIQQTNRWPVNTHEWKTRKVITNYIFPIKLLERHQFFGQFEFIKKSKRETRAVSMEDTVCLSINKNDFEAFFKDGDLKVLQKMNENYMPSHQEMEKITRLNIQSAKMSQEILLDAMKIRVLPVDKDCLAGINSKKLKNWITCLQKRNMHEEHKIGERIVRRVLKKDLGEDKDTVSQLPKIGNAEMVNARSRSGIIPIGSVRKSECDEFLQYSRNNRAFSVLQKKGVNPLAISKQFSPVFGISHKSRV